MSPTDDLLSRYDYHLPPELIAQHPPEQRGDSRLMVVDRAAQAISHHHFQDLPQFLQPSDLLVLNNTRVVRARLRGFRTKTGGKWEGLYLRSDPDGHWRIIGQTRGRLQSGETLTIPAVAHGDDSQLLLRLEETVEPGEWRCRPLVEGDWETLLRQFGDIPLPPYVDRASEAADLERYQTTYAAVPGAVAAPTAGLHFTPDVLNQCREKGIHATHVTLHVGLGTFRPVTAEQLSEHVMHYEWCRLTPESARVVQQCRNEGGRVCAVGTTAVRTLETASQQGTCRPFEGETNLFIRPPYQFRTVDRLLTNFHLPKSTLLMLVSALATRELIFEAYSEAIAERYRFFSYGDAMLIL